MKHRTESPHRRPSDHRHAARLVALSPAFCILALGTLTLGLPAGAQSPGPQYAPMRGAPYPGQGTNLPPGYTAQGNFPAAAAPVYVADSRGNAQGPTAGTLIPSLENPAEADSEAAAEEPAVSGPGVWSGMGQRLMSGGPLMIPLGICSLVVIALAVERLISLRRGRIIPRPFVRRFTECVQDGQLSHDEALAICDEFDCPVAEVFHAAVKRWGRPTVEVEQAVMDAGERVADGLRKYLRLFHAVSNVAPLLGLLGTVLGMIEAFESLSSTSDATPDMLASGISEALMTTAAGLSVAIPAYLAYIYFSARADRYLVDIDGLCQQVVDSISAEGLQNGGSARGNRRGKRAA